jgi:hypothetical protein
MGIESDRVVCRGEEKRNCKEIALGVEQEKVEGRVSIGLFVSLSLTISALYKIAISLFGLLLQLCWWRMQVRSLGTCSPDYTSEDNGFDIHCCEHLVICLSVLSLVIRKDKQGMVSVFVCSYRFV